LEVSPETIALDVIEKVGPGAHYLSQKHTRTHMRANWAPGLGHELDNQGKFRDPKDVARERLTWILKNHQPEPLPGDQRKEIKKILAAADKELKE
jgi:trimethylamine--corrinoid protein Co-methyltransferase